MPFTKKNAAPKPAKHDRRSSSRHSTPVSALTEESPAPPTPLDGTPVITTPHPASAAVPPESAYLSTATAALLSGDVSIEQLIRGTTARASDPPSAKELFALHDRLRDTLNKTMSKRGEVCDRSMRQLVQKRKERVQAEREAEAEREARELAALKEWEREDGERRRGKKEKEKEKGLSRKRSRDEMEVDAPEQDEEKERAKRRESLPSVGAHGLARQNGVGVHEGVPPPPSPPVQPGTAIIDPMDTAPSPSDSEDARADAPSTIPLYERAFGQDPSQFDDHTIYDIRPVAPDMTDDEKREIYNVLYWPTVDLGDYTAGTPPDEDFSAQKPANQVNFATFQTYVEPYIRPFTEEDVAFLKERGDRLTPYVIPNRGGKSYKDVWAAEDGLTGIEPPAKFELNPNEPRGSMEEMDDATAETDEISHGPTMERLLSLMRPQPIGNTSKKDDTIETDANGDTTMLNPDDDANPATQLGAPPDDQPTFRPATQLPPDAPRPPNLPPLDYPSLEARAIQELRYAGLLPPHLNPADPSTNPPTAVANYAAHADDEVAARLRTLQHELRRVSRANNARKARVLELTEERMAGQEYGNIADDLDNQVNAAYLKRNRSLAGKPAKKGGGGGAHSLAAVQGRKGGVGVGAGGVGGGAGRQVSEGVRALMQKRRDWIEMVGPVVGYGRPEILGEGETVFDAGSLGRWEGVEREVEAGEVDGVGGLVGDGE
ncbi:Transcriptional regulator [Teratosphaeriaceae sp. CCFEE 6253]|nr:Transcriptional regulator [Teratosphaeriaceae sp. CCFEE 6253]